MTLRADVEALAALDRRSASAGERASAAWCAERLRAAGASEVRIEPYRYQHSFGHAHALHFAAATLGRVPAALAFAGFELDYSGRAQPLRRLLPAGEGANVVGRIPAASSPQPARHGVARRTLVLIAHHDAAHTGLMWDPRLTEHGAKPDGRPPFSLLPELAMAALAVGPRRAHWPARALLAFATALSLQVARGATVPGASDNATGVAAVLALVERLAADPPPGVEVVALLPGSEESGMGGMRAWIEGEGDYGTAELDLADAAAARAGLPAPRRFRLGGWTDPVLARIAGLPAISLLSLRGNAFTDYHLSTDTPDRVDWASVEACLALAEAIVREWGTVRGN